MSVGLRNTEISYGSVSKFFHWLIFILLFVMIIYGFCLAYIPKNYQGIAFNIHKLTGLTILVLMILRLLWSFINPKPMLPFDTPVWQRIGERIVHWSLYLVIIAMPLAGWIGSCAAGRPPHIDGLRLDLPIQKNDALVDTAFNVHNTLALVIIALFCIHVMAALYHHFIKKDDILRRMLPNDARY